MAVQYIRNDVSAMGYMELHALTLAARSYALLVIHENAINNLCGPSSTDLFSTLS